MNKILVKEIIYSHVGYIEHVSIVTDYFTHEIQCVDVKLFFYTRDAMCRNNSQTLHTCTLTRGGSRLFVGGAGGGGVDSIIIVHKHHNYLPCLLLA